MSYLQYPFPEEITAFSTCRQGGCGTGTYASFNCTHYCGDNPEHVASNREKLCRDWGITPDRLFIPRQVHDVQVAVVDEEFLASRQRNRASALREWMHCSHHWPDVAWPSPQPTVCLYYYMIRARV